MDEPTKICRICKEEKKLSEFGILRRNKDGHNSACLKCTHDISSAKYQANKEKYSQKAKAYYIKNKEEIDARVAQYKKDHPDKVIESRQKFIRAHPRYRNDKKVEWAKANPDKVNASRQRAKEGERGEKNKQKKREYSKANRAKNRERMRKRRENNPGAENRRVREWKRNNKDKVSTSATKYRKSHPQKALEHNRKRRAQKRNVVRTLSDTEWTLLLELCGYVCVCCGRADSEVPLTHDHIVPLDPGEHTLANSQPLCNQCNPRKGRKTIDYRPEWLKRLVEEYINATTG